MQEKDGRLTAKPSHVGRHKASAQRFAQTRSKYESTVMVQCMLNNSWPSIIWNLYDYYFVPSGAYFGSKKACERLHVQYSSDDNSVAVLRLSEKFLHSGCVAERFRTATVGGGECSAKICIGQASRDVRSP